MKRVLVDTNIFLEILLNQVKKSQCKLFLNDHIGQLFISDFSLHSIGVILLKHKNGKVFEKFIDDVLPAISIITLSKDKYIEVIKTAIKFNMDFDDAYQACLSIDREMEIVTMDKDFKKVEGVTKIKFL